MDTENVYTTSKKNIIFFSCPIGNQGDTVGAEKVF